MSPARAATEPSLTVAHHAHSPAGVPSDPTQTEFPVVSLTPSDILASAQAGRFVIQDFRPLAESIEWELSRQYFEQRGSKAFVTGGDHVPFEINNNGNLSLNTAEVFFANLAAAEDAGT